MIMSFPFYFTCLNLLQIICFQLSVRFQELPKGIACNDSFRTDVACQIVMKLELSLSDEIGIL